MNLNISAGRQRESLGLSILDFPFTIIMPRIHNNNIITVSAEMNKMMLLVKSLLVSLWFHTSKYEGRKKRTFVNTPKAGAKPPATTRHAKLFTVLLCVEL